MSKSIRGSCLCGGVRFEVDPPFIQASHCHCERCRKHSGTAVAFDVDPGIRPQFHTFVADRAPWDTITDDLPQYPERKNS